MGKSTLLPVVEQAGAVLYRMVGGETQILTVRSKTFPEQRIFPKGHIDDGETEEAAAMRELLEEAGMIGKIVGYAGTREFDYKKKRYRVRYYAASFVSVDNNGELGREPLWASVSETRDFLPSEDLKEVLDNCVELIKGNFK